MPDVPLPQTGRCLCGAVTWTATAPPVRVGWCHCSQCRRQTGAPAAAFAIFPADAVAIVGPEAYHRSSTFARRRFCPACGSPIAWVGDGEPTIDVHLGTADDPSAFVPTYELFAADAVGWMPRQHGIVRFEGERDG
jgi:hypothetical protein